VELDFRVYFAFGNNQTRDPPISDRFPAPGLLVRGRRPHGCHATSAGRGLKSRPVAESRRRRVSMGAIRHHQSERRAEPECCRLPSMKAAPTSSSTSYVYGEHRVSIVFPHSANHHCRSLIHLPRVQVGAARSFLAFLHRSLDELSFLTAPGTVRPKMSPPPFPPLHGALGRATHGRRHALTGATAAPDSHGSSLCVPLPWCLPGRPF
jgi:hypothetical protein